MNYIFMVCTEDYVPYAKRCLDSLQQHAKNDYMIHIAYYLSNKKMHPFDFGSIYAGCSLELVRLVGESRPKALKVISVPTGQWICQIAYRKVILLHEFAMNQLKEDDKILIIDADLKFKCDPFEIFNSNSDIYYTTRHYKYHFPVNEGFWGFRWNQYTEHFIEFYRDQIRNPTWEPYVGWLKKYWHWGQKNWGIGQDFLCALHEMRGALYNNYRWVLENLGPCYNYCPSVEENDLEGTWGKAREEMRRAEKEPGVKVLHYKGRLKEMM